MNAIKVKIGNQARELINALMVRLPKPVRFWANSEVAQDRDQFSCAINRHSLYEPQKCLAAIQTVCGNLHASEPSWGEQSYLELCVLFPSSL